MNQKKKPEEKRGILKALNGSGELIKLRRDATILGRENGDVLINDHEVSSTHCQIQNIGGTYHIFDMNSTNGTYVNNERIVKAKLSPGDQIGLGRVAFQFVLEDENKVRHISTIFRAKEKRGGTDGKGSLVDTLIDSEVRGGRQAQVILQVRYGDGSREDINLTQRTFFIGRASTFGKFEHDPEISRRHILVKINDNNEVFIEDQGSTNGSFLNGKKIIGMNPVTPADEIKVGTSLVKILVKS